MHPVLAFSCLAFALASHEGPNSHTEAYTLNDKIKKQRSGRKALPSASARWTVFESRLVLRLLALVEQGVHSAILTAQKHGYSETKISFFACITCQPKLQSRHTYFWGSNIKPGKKKSKTEPNPFESSGRGPARDTQPQTQQYLMIDGRTCPITESEPWT